MPPKRTAPATDNLSPSPAQRPAPAPEHHFSPIRGQRPDVPADAAVALMSPPRNQHQHNAENADRTADDGNDQQSMPPQSSTPIAESPPVITNSIVANGGARAAFAASPPVITNSIEANGGARAAFAASQQQRSTTCNLTSIPASRWQL